MTKWLVLAAAIAVVAVVGYLVAMKRLGQAVVTGQPTPEEARVKYERAEQKATQVNEQKIEEIRDAPNDEQLRRARARVRDGLQPK